MRFNSRGQSILPEYVVTFFLAIAVIIAMTVYIRRGLQARVYDARSHMMQVATDECDDNCKAAARVQLNGNLPLEYEPYYTKIESVTERDHENTTGIIADGGSSGIFRKRIDEKNRSRTQSTQLPPKDAY